MRRIALSIAFATLLVAGIARAELRAGQTAPDFTAPATLGGREFTFSLGAP
jgi:thioredoxin-dependent peroxiredoxin